MSEQKKVPETVWLGAVIAVIGVVVVIAMGNVAGLIVGGALAVLGGVRFATGLVDYAKS